MTNPLLEISQHESDGGNYIGRDPREIPAHQYAEFLPDAPVGLKAIRAKCLDCAENAVEVRKCVAVSCPLWPLRMGSMPKGMREVRGHDMTAKRGGFHAKTEE